MGLRNEVVAGVLTEKIVEPYSVADGKVDCIKAYIDGEKVASGRLYANEATLDFFSKIYPTDSVVRQR